MIYHHINTLLDSLKIDIFFRECIDSEIPFLNQ